MSDYPTRMPTVGTVLNMTPASGVVQFIAPDGETWTLPLVGWGVWVSYVDKRTGEWETSVAPMILAEDRYPDTLSSYLRDLDGDVQAQVVIDK